MSVLGGFFFKTKIYWSIVDFNVVLVSGTQKSESVYIYIYLSPLLLDSFPIQTIAEYWVKFPVLYSGFLLVIYFYSWIHFSIMCDRKPT